MRAFEEYVQSVYEANIAYAMRKALLCEMNKVDLNKKIRELEMKKIDQTKWVAETKHDFLRCVDDFGAKQTLLEEKQEQVTMKCVPWYGCSTASALSDSFIVGAAPPSAAQSTASTTRIGSDGTSKF